MAHIVLLHSILGLRPAERDIAAVLETDGHTVVLPDLYAGQSTDAYDEGFRLSAEIGEEVIEARARAGIDDAPDNAVLAGVSFGAFLIGRFWDERPKMAGALLLAGCAPWMTPRRPMPVSVHVARPDPFDDEEFFEDWVAGAGEVALEVHRYDGAGHYFLDRSVPDSDAAAADLCLERARTFLRRL